MRERRPAVHILESGKRGTSYVGVTSDLIARIHQHKHDQVDGCTKKYRVHALVWYELHDAMESAIVREKQIKEWKRAWKLELIETSNASWQDLYDSLLG